MSKKQNPRGGEQGGKREAGSAGKQSQKSQQSLGNYSEAGGHDVGAGSSAAADGTGIGSSQGQDRGTGRRQRSDTGRPSAGTPDLPRDRPSAGSADIERENARSDDSMVNDPTGAYKERP